MSEVYYPMYFSDHDEWMEERVRVYHDHHEHGERDIELAIIAATSYMLPGTTIVTVVE